MIMRSIRAMRCMCRVNASRAVIATPPWCIPGCFAFPVYSVLADDVYIMYPFLLYSRSFAMCDSCINDICALRR